ncbi:MAG: hypothetical protein E5299_01483 [Burkholderia gladioli]|nr:MAG: hypothetical protein E5299_01483 [Burkholderia gladioli]
MRSLPREASEERPRQVINLRRRGWIYDEIAEYANLARTGAFDICKRYAREVAARLREKPSGGAVNPRRALNEQEDGKFARCCAIKCRTSGRCRSRCGRDMPCGS